MTDVFTKEKRSVVMSRIRARGNKDTEAVLAQLLRANGIAGWRRNSSLFGKPDFVFPRARIAIFVDGCFWHGCPKHGTSPKSNTEYWHVKLFRNKIRDRAVGQALKKKGWRVIRIWEHDLKRPSTTVHKIVRALNDVALAVKKRIESNRHE